MSYNPFTLSGKRILITGASSGIGRATAIECAKLGATCVLCGRNEERLRETMSQLEGSGHVCIVADFLNTEDLHSMASQCGQLDGIVCNAGINLMAPIYFLKETEVNQVFQTNTFAPMYLLQALLKARKVNAKASLVFTSSIDAANPDVSSSAYAASKAALTSFMRSCAKELAPRQIRANAVHPGLVETGMKHNGMVSDEDLEKNKELYLLKRYAQPEEIAWAIIYLLSNAASFVTGSVLTIDGGISIN
ncbi:MAG: SDR family oxidoreductase [Paludibacteraceae bacterium]|nr:SDR family oxidoreductase [Paludibacteraceae bacterium]